jgi:hypothetical protein
MLFGNDVFSFELRFGLDEKTVKIRKNEVKFLKFFD